MAPKKRTRAGPDPLPVEYDQPKQRLPRRQHHSQREKKMILPRRAMRMSDSNARTVKRAGKVTFQPKFWLQEGLDETAPQAGASCPLRLPLADSVNFTRLMSQAKPSVFSTQMPYQLISTSYQVKPCCAAVG